MTLDRFDHLDLYAGLSPRFARAVAFLKSTDLDRLPTGRVEIDGDAVFAIVLDAPTKPRDTVRYESHRRYHDIQAVTHGAERMGYADVDTLPVAEPYAEATDLTWHDGSGVEFLVPAGHFAIFTPRDAHAPSIAVGAPERVRKIVVKVAV